MTYIHVVGICFGYPGWDHSYSNNIIMIHGAYSTEKYQILPKNFPLNNSGDWVFFYASLSHAYVHACITCTCPAHESGNFWELHMWFGKNILVHEISITFFCMPKRSSGQKDLPSYLENRTWLSNITMGVALSGTLYVGDGNYWHYHNFVIIMHMMDTVSKCD